MSDEKKQQAKRVAADNGIVNPSGAFIAAFAPFYLACVPLTSYVTKSDSIIQSLTHALIKCLPGVNAASITSGRAIPALATLYIFWAFGASGAISVAGQAMARKEGIDVNHCRKYINLLDGLPLRMRSAHYNLIENFPAFALAAAMAQTLAPNDAQIVNLLGFHVMTKLLVHYPSYLMGVGPPRTLAHFLATSAVINVCWRLAAGS